MNPNPMDIPLTPLSPPPPPHIYSCIVVGAGLSGLSASSYLLSHGVSDVLVLEARERVGGRSYSPLHAETNVHIDMGGAYVGPSQNHILSLISSLGLSTHLCHSSTDLTSVLQIDSKQHSYKGHFPPVSPFSLLDTNNLFVLTDTLVKSMNPLAPWSMEKAEELDKMTVEQWIQLHGETVVAKELYRGVIQGILCVEPAEVSMFAWLSYLSSGNRSLLRVISAENGAQERKIVGGTQQLSIRLMERIGREKVILNSPVKIIDWNPEKTKANVSEQEDRDNREGEGRGRGIYEGKENIIKITCVDGREYYSYHSILALSPSLYSSIHFSPYFPLKKQLLAEKTFMGSIIKTVTRYSRPFWREKGYNGIVFSMEGPIMYSYDDCYTVETHPSASSPFYGLMGFILAEPGRRYQSMTTEERKQAVVTQYYHSFGKEEEALSPMEYMEFDWNREVYSKGCYGAIAPPLLLSHIKEQLKAPIEHLHFAGTELACTWAGYLDGAIESGEHAAHEILKEKEEKGEMIVVEGKEGGKLGEYEIYPTPPTDLGIKEEPAEFSWWERRLPKASTVKMGISIGILILSVFAAKKIKIR